LADHRTQRVWQNIVIVPMTGDGDDAHFTADDAPILPMASCALAMQFEAVLKQYGYKTPKVAP
jgi:hypothetical protein